MTTERFAITYEIVTPESAADGDVAERGFCSPGGWKHEDRAMHTLRDAIHAAERSYSKHGSGFEDSGFWWTTVDGDQNYRTGEETTYAIHPPKHITPSSYARITRLLTGRKGR